MALEPITRQEKIIAGQDLTPITRLEKFLKQFGGGGGGSVPKPLTYDYMPEGYPTKTVQTTTLMEEQEVAFSTKGDGIYVAVLIDALDVVGGQTYTVNWDGTEYKCVCNDDGGYITLGNLSIMGEGADTGEPFLFLPTEQNVVVTPDASATHTISVKRIEEIVTPMAEEFLPAGGVTTLHINVTAINRETMEATFTADKTPLEMEEASITGPIWCVVTIAAGLMAEEAVSMGAPPAWDSGFPAFGSVTANAHNDNGNNKTGYVVRQGDSDNWIFDASLFGG